MKKTNPLKIVEIENYANNLRKELGIPSNSFFPVLEELEKHEYRANFTLAHELFHYFQCQVLGFEFEEVENCPSFEDPEW